MRPGPAAPCRSSQRRCTGSGARPLVRALTTAGFDAPYLVPEQAEPDPEFPTVAFPNPEEPGALDLALAAARDRGADLVIANDPDADRCAVAIPAPSVDGGWRALRGDELGALLAEHLLSRRRPRDGGRRARHRRLLDRLLADARPDRRRARPSVTPRP